MSTGKRLRLNLREDEASIHDYNGSSWTQLDVDTAADSDEDTWYTVRIVADGATLKVYKGVKGGTESLIFNETSVSTYNGSRIQFIVDADNEVAIDNIRLLVDDLENTMTYTYASNNELSTMVDYNGMLGFVYDAKGRTSEVKSPRTIIATCRRICILIGSGFRAYVAEILRMASGSSPAGSARAFVRSLRRSGEIESVRLALRWPTTTNGSSVTIHSGSPPKDPTHSIELGMKREAVAGSSRSRKNAFIAIELGVVENPSRRRLKPLSPLRSTSCKGTSSRAQSPAMRSINCAARSIHSGQIRHHAPSAKAIPCNEKCAA